MSFPPSLFSSFPFFHERTNLKVLFLLPPKMHDALLYPEVGHKRWPPFSPSSLLFFSSSQAATEGRVSFSFFFPTHEKCDLLPWVLPPPFPLPPSPPPHISKTNVNFFRLSCQQLRRARFPPPGFCRPHTLLPFFYPLDSDNGKHFFLFLAYDRTRFFFPTRFSHRHQSLVVILPSFRCALDANFSLQPFFPLAFLILPWFFFPFFPSTHAFRFSTLDPSFPQAIFSSLVRGNTCAVSPSPP